MNVCEEIHTVNTFNAINIGPHVELDASNNELSVLSYKSVLYFESFIYKVSSLLYGHIGPILHSET